MPKLVPNRPRLEDVQKALLSAPRFAASLGLTEDDLNNFGNEENPPLGQGHYAYAYALPDGGVLKITDDPDDAAAADLIRRTNENGEYPVGLLHVRAVKRFKNPVYWNETDKNEKRHLYAVVTETVQPLRAYVRDALAGLPKPGDATIKGLLRMMVVENIWTMRAAADDDRGPLGMSADMREFAQAILDGAPALAEMLDEVMQGVRWLSLHGFDVIDLHPGNFGRAVGHRTVLFDFGHGSRNDSTPLPEPALATNGRKPSAEETQRVWMSLGKPKVDLNELRMGIEIEQEHGVGLNEAGKIAMDHLREFGDYYTRLVKMEARAKAGLAPNVPSYGSMKMFDSVEALNRWLETTPLAPVKKPVSGRVAYLSHLEVPAEERGKGVGTAAAAALIEDARRQGARYVFLQAGDPWSRSTQRQEQFWGDKLGFTKLPYDDGSYFAPPMLLDLAKGVTPNGRSMPKVRAAFDECFARIEEQFPDFGVLELHQDEKAGADNGHGSERQFGYCMDGKPIRIAFAAKTEGLPVANIRGLVAHEFGHALDYRYGKDLGRMLGRRLPEGVERRADAIAKAVFGNTIKYDERDIQCVRCEGAEKRPRRLGP